MSGPDRRRIAPRKESLRARVLRDIKAEIVSGLVTSSHVYSVPALAAEMGVSTTPVREALLELHRQGLVDPLPNRGFRVVVPSNEELLELLKLREVLETYAMDRVARRRPDLARLVPLAEQIAAAVEASDPLAYVTADREFHLALVAEAGVPTLTRFVGDLRDHIRLIGLDTDDGRARQRESATEHFALLALLEDGDGPGVRRIISRHISQWENVLRAGTDDGSRGADPAR